MLIFLSSYCDCTLRDYKEYNSFLSKIDHKSGTVSVEGPKFLKTYFIENTTDPRLPKVLPYRPITELVIKSFLDLEPDNLEKGMLKAIGLAWNSLGTNMRVFEAARGYYDFVKSVSCRSPLEIYQDFKRSREGEKDINRICRQIGRSAKELFDHFPLWSELRDRHVRNDTKNSFGAKANIIQYLGEQGGVPVSITEYIDN